jgi:hypothetical protein
MMAAVLPAALLAGGVMALATTDPHLVAHGPTSVEGTAASSVFRIGDRTVRQVRYADHKTLVYSFALANDGHVPVTVTGLAGLGQSPRLFRYVGISDGEGHETFTIPAGGRRTVEVSMLMHACETLSARAGSFATQVGLRTERAGVVHDDVIVAFPEEVHTGSPREAFCPRATATSRPPG